MNAAYPSEGAFAASGFGFRGAPYGDLSRIRDPWLPELTVSATGGLVSTTVQPGLLQLTAANSGGAAVTAANVWPNFTVGNASGAVSTTTTTTTVTTGVARPASPPPLEVRRFYHWNLSATAASAGTDPPHPRMTPDMLVPVSDERDAIQVTESEAVQVNGHGRQRRTVRGTLLSPRALTRAAVFMAGKKRSAVELEWRGHLLGESGHSLTQREQACAACGFVWAAVRYRLRDATDQAWRPVDAILRSRTWSNLFVLIPAAVASLFILRNGGTLGVVKSAESIIAIGGIFYGMIRAGRRWRDVQPPDPKVRRVKGQ
jgi:hypothetical protein